MIHTKYGTLNGAFGCQYYEDGSLKSCKLEKENTLETEYGKLVPQYEILESRTRDRNSVEFFSNGVLKSIYLNQAGTVKTPLGEIKSEFVTFYESGKVHRLFPTFGKVGGTWSEEDEKAITPNIKLDVNGIPVNHKLSALCFYETGSIKSISLYPGEQVEASIHDRMLKVRFGIAFYETGEIKSLEPAAIAPVRTGVGSIFAYDNFANGVSGDNNSLTFHKDGEVYKISTVLSGLTITNKQSGEKSHVQALRKPSRLDIEQWEMYPVHLTFMEDGLEVIDSDDKKTFYEKEKYEISSYYSMLYIMDESEGECSCDCSKCNGCI